MYFVIKVRVLKQEIPGILSKISEAQVRVKSTLLAFQIGDKENDSFDK